LNTRNQKRKTGARGRNPRGDSGERERRRTAYGNAGRWHSVSFAVILFCAVFAVLVAADYWMNAGKVYRGVEVGDVSLGGKTPAEAKEIIGERSSHTWFVLNYLLGYGNVRNYDGSWTEWGNAVRAPIER